MSKEALFAHLAEGVTTVSRCWSITRNDGVTLGFTDHDLSLSFDGVEYRPETGMTAKALQQSTSLAVDNTEAVGALSDDRISEADINAGLYDDAEVLSWLVNWHDTDQRRLIFRGNIGDIRRKGSAFDVELRGLTDRLNQVQGRVYQKPCSAVLGDKGCNVDLTHSDVRAEVTLLAINDRRSFVFSDLAAYADGWFARGRFEVVTGDAAGLSGWIQGDETQEEGRTITLWEPIRGALAAGDTIALIAGCDKRKATCASKFGNIVNFQGFPFIPGEDWLAAFPSQGDQNDGGALV